MATPSMAGGGQRTPGRRRDRGPLQQSELASRFCKKRERGGQRTPGQRGGGDLEVYDCVGTSLNPPEPLYMRKKKRKNKK